MKGPEQRFDNPFAACVASLCIAAAAASLASAPAVAQTYPTHPITTVVPFPPGGPADAPARVVADRMQRSLGQPLVIENVSGASGSIGTGRVVRAKPDGYTLVVGNTSTHVMNAALYSLPYDVLNDFAPIAPVARASLIVVGRKDLPAKDLHELAVWLKANPNKVSAAVTTVGIRLLEMNFQKETGSIAA